MDDCAGAQGVNAIAVTCDDDRGVGDPGASSRIADLDNETWRNHQCAPRCGGLHHVASRAT